MSDITPPPRLHLDWTSKNSKDSLEKVYDHVMDVAEKTTAWYVRGKNIKRFFARSFRMLSIILGTIAALLPTLWELFGQDGKSIIGAGWTAVLLGLVGAFLVLDRFFGFSIGWMRYISADLELRQKIQEFQLDWEIDKTSWDDGDPNKDEVTKMLGLSKNFAAEVNLIVVDETNTWVKEFKRAIHQIDESVKPRTQHGTDT